MQPSHAPPTLTHGPRADGLRLFVKFPYPTTEHDLIEMFAPYGDLYKVQVQHDRMGLPRGFGFVEMERHWALLAIEELHGQAWGGRPLEVKVAVPRGEQR